MTDQPLRILLLLAVASASAFAQDGSSDPAFSRIPFDEWLKGGEQSRIRWSVKALHPALSMHQRLQVELEIRLDGADLEERLGKGGLITFFQLTGADGHRYQTHGAIDLTRVEPGVKASYITYTQSAFVLPGEYRLAAAIYVTATKEHGVRQDRLRVAPLHGDPLPAAWRTLPPVEFVAASQQPESWYLPSIKGRLYLPVAPAHPVRIEVIANVSPSEQPARGRRTASWHPDVLIPAVKAVSQIDAHPGTSDVELVDVLRRRVVFRQAAAAGLDWPKMKESLTEASAGTIDLKSLEDRRHDLAFFVSELNKRIEAADGEARAIIVLTNAVEFESSQDLGSAHLAPSPGCRVFYIRVVAPAARPVFQEMPQRRGRGRMGPAGRQAPMVREDAIDQIEPVLKPLGPRVFEVGTPDQLRKALAAILSEIAAM